MTQSTFRALIRSVKYIKRPTNALRFCGCNFIAQWSPTCFGQSRGHLQGGDNKNTDTIKMCLNHTTVSESFTFRL